MKRTSSTMADSPEFPPPAPPNHRKKKTRELPNLSDCHCCNLRINSTNPKNRLRILASEWRIILLCRCCYNLVESSQLCSYCLTRVSSSSMDSFCECKRCHRRIHKQCVSMFSFGASGNDSSSLDFSVCFDCWIPKLIENDYHARVSDNRTKKKGVKIGVESMNSLGSSGVCNSQERGKSLEVAVNGVHAVAEKKVAVALAEKEKAINKAMDANRAVVLASSAVGLNASDKDGDQRGSVVDDDAQLAIRLHRAMNSSPRISGNSCLLNTHCVDVPEVNGNIDGLEFQVGGETCCSSKPTNISIDERNGLSETRQECKQHCVRTQDEKRIGDFGHGLITYCRKGWTTFKVNCEEDLDCFQSTYDRGWSSGDVRNKEELDCSLRTYHRGWSSGDIRIKEEPDCSLRTYKRRLTKDKRCKVEHGHWSKTYSRRHLAIPHCKSNLIYGSFNLDNGTCAPAISLKCYEDSRAFSTAS